jgi:pilus assembly protein Flp/PilA
MVKMIKRLLRLEEGATMVEYGLMVALIAAVCLAAVTAIGQSTSGIFQQVAGAITGAGA